MGPRLRVDATTFLAKARMSGNPVVHTGKEFLQGYTYVVRSGDYFYYTQVRRPLDLSGLASEQVAEVKL